MSQDRPPQPTQRAPLYAAALVLSTLTTVAAVGAYLFFRSIDDANVASAEANGFDPTQLTPHGDLLWLLLITAVPASVVLTTGLLSQVQGRGVRRLPRDPEVGQALMA